MANDTLTELAKKMQGIDFATLFTKTDSGAMAGRPMSNNGDVDYDGDSFYFTYEQYRTVSDVERDPKVSLSFHGCKGLLGQRPFFACVQGAAELIRDRAQFEAHWTKDIDRWFPQGSTRRGSC